MRTYKPPNKKIPTIASFLARLICNFHRHGTGNTSTATSEKMLNAVRLCVKAYWLKHRPPVLMDLSQKYVTGTQENMTPKTAEIHQRIMNTPVAMQNLVNVLEVKIRR